MGSVKIGMEGTGHRRVPEWVGEGVLYGKYWSESGLGSECGSIEGKWGSTKWWIMCC